MVLLIAFVSLCVGGALQTFADHVYALPAFDSVSRTEQQVAGLREQLNKLIPAGGSLGCFNESRHVLACNEVWYSLLPRYAKARQTPADAADEYLVIVTEPGAVPAAALPKYRREANLAPGIHLYRRQP